MLRDLRNGVAKEMKYPDYFALAGRRLRNDDGRDGQDARTTGCDAASALPPTAYLDEIQTGGEISSAGAEENSGALDQQSLGQEWTGLVEAANIDKYFKGENAEWIIKTAEQFYTGLGFSPLPPSFWAKSDLYPVPPGDSSARKTRTPPAGISIWRMTFVRCKASSRMRDGFSPRTTSWVMVIISWLTRGRKFRRLLRTRRRIPDSTKAIGELISLASSQVPYLQSRGVLPADFKADTTAFLLDDALARSIPFIYFSCGRNAALGGGHLRAEPAG